MDIIRLSPTTVIYNRPDNLSHSVKKTQNKGYYGAQGHRGRPRGTKVSPYIRFPISD